MSGNPATERPPGGRRLARVAVVGAGLAGLNAAAELARAGVEPVVLEARGRVGGRVHSQLLPNGAVIERGAEFILPGNTAIRELAAELGLELWDKGVRYGRRRAVGGRPVSDRDLIAALAAIERELAEREGAGGDPVEEFLERLEIDPGAREYLLCRVEISAAAAASSVPAADLLGVAHVGDDDSPGIAGGNQRLADALAERLGSAVHLSSPVERIVADGGLVRLSAGGSEVSADAAVVAVPARVLGAISFEPALPEAQAAALAAVAYGHAAKLFAPLRQAAAPAAVMSLPERYWCWNGDGADGGPQAALSAFAGSTASLERLGVSEGPDRWLRSLSELRPELELVPEGAVLARWSDDPLSGAAYSISPGAEAADMMQGPPGGSIAFAGEHLGGAFSGLMEGALRSGREAARRLLAAG